MKKNQQKKPAKNKKSKKNTKKKSKFYDSSDSEEQEQILDDQSFIDDFDQGEDLEEYEVEEIRQKREIKGKIQFLVKWSGKDECTWEPVDNLDGCLELLTEYLDFEDEMTRQKQYEEQEKFLKGKLKYYLKYVPPSLLYKYFSTVENNIEVLQNDKDINQEKDNDITNNNDFSSLKIKKLNPTNTKKVNFEKQDKEVEAYLEKQQNLDIQNFQTLNYKIDDNELSQIKKEKCLEQKDIEEIDQLLLDKDYVNIRKLITKKINKDYLKNKRKQIIKQGINEGEIDAYLISNIEDYQYINNRGISQAGGIKKYSLRQKKKYINYNEKFQ